MDRNRVILGVVVALVLLSAVKIPAIPVETEASTVYEVESQDEEFSASGLEGNAVRAETEGDDGGATTSGSSDDGSETDGSDSDDGPPGSPLNADRASMEYDVPLAHEIVSVEVSGSVEDSEFVVAVEIRNVDDEAGEFGATVDYERDGNVVERGRTDQQVIAPNETATVRHSTPYSGDADDYVVNVSIDAETRTIESTVFQEPDTSTENATLPVHEVPMDHALESVEVSESADGSDLVVDVELRNADEMAGEFGADVTYVRDGNVIERAATNRRTIQPDGTATVRDSFTYAGEAGEYAVDVSVDPDRKVIGSTSEPDTSTVNASVPVHEVALDHEVVDVNTSVSGEDLVSTVVVRNDDDVRGEFTVEFTYRNESGTRTVVREPTIAPGETETMTSTVPFESYEVSVSVTPGTKAVGAPGDGEVDATTETVTHTTTVTREERVTVLEFFRRLLG
jgi:hypothetical protein